MTPPQLQPGVTRWVCPACGDRHDTFRVRADLVGCHRCGQPVRAVRAEPSKVRPGNYTYPNDAETLGLEILREAQNG
jgi:hypothetical protein